MVNLVIMEAGHCQGTEEEVPNWSRGSGKAPPGGCEPGQGPQVRVVCVV